MSAIVKRIDIHQHVIPPFWVQGLRARNDAHKPPAWSAKAAIAFMDARDIAKGILSLTAPGIQGWPEDERPAFAREVNIYTAGLVRQWPARFGSFATLPLPDVDAAIREVHHAFEVLGADGVVLLSNYDDLYLGDRTFEPLWAELDGRSSVVFIHPGRTSLRDLEGIPPPFVDFPFATTRAAVELVLNGVLDRYRNVRIVLSHGGGFLPYAADRFARCAAALPSSVGKDALLEKFRRFYLDTALTSSPFALPSLKAFADPSRIVFGTDFPYAPGGMAEEFTAGLDASTVLSKADHAAINQSNVRALLEGLSLTS